MLKPREKTPEITISLVNDTEWKLSKQNVENFTLVVFYRGKHCPVCKNYLQDLSSKLNDFSERGVNVIAISANTEEIAKETYEDWDINGLPIGYEFPIAEARKWGLFVSKGIKKEPDVFFEPGLFLIRPNMELYCASIQTMPFARPDFEDVLKAIDFVVEKEYPARGEA